MAACVDALVFLSDTEVETECFGVANVQVAVWFWRESGNHSFVLTARDIFGDDFADEIEFFFFLGAAHVWRVLVA